MATAKTWTAHDVEMGKLVIGRSGTAVLLNRGYHFMNDQGEIIDSLPAGRVVGRFAWASLPTNIQDALTAIDTWTYDQALAQEEMT
jgi:hypothetical protein